MGLKHDALRNYWAFLELIKFKGGTSNFGAVHKELVDFLQGPSRRKFTLMARGHLKSTLGSVGKTLWGIYKNPNIRIMVGTADKKLSTAFIRELKQYLEDVELQEKVWNNRPHIPGRLIPNMDSAGQQRRRKRQDEFEEIDFTEAEDKKVVWRGDALQVIRDTVSKEPTVMASSVGTVMTGLHFDRIVFDDIVTYDNSDTPTKVQRVKDWVKDIQSVLDPYNPQTELGGEIDIFGTRYSLDDYYAEILDKKDSSSFVFFERNVYKNGTDDAEGFTWPERFNQEVVDQLREDLGSARFASQYMNLVISEEEKQLRSSDIQWIHRNNAIVKDGYVEVHFEGSSKPQFIRPYLVIDPAISMKKTADNSVIMVGGINYEKDLFIFDYKSGKFKPNQIVELTYELMERWKLHAATIETIAYQASLLDTFRDSFRQRKPIVLREFRPQGDKKARISTNLEPLFANKKVYMVSWISSQKAFMDEIDYFPRASVKDDHIDAMSILNATASAVVPKSARKPAPLREVNSLFGGFR